MTSGGPDLTQWHPFHVSHWPQAVAVPAQHQGGDRVWVSWDLGALPEKERKQAIKQWCVALPQLQDVRWLSLWSQVTPPVLEAACHMGQLECLQLKWTNVKTLEGMRQLTRLRYLHVGSSTKVESIAPLASLSQLRLLELENFKAIQDFQPLVALTKLESLSITGSMWSRQCVESVEPLAKMTWLTSLAVDTSTLDSVRPLAALQNLKTLGLGGRLPVEEYAWLSVHMPHTQCRWFQPFLELASTGIGRCKQCSQETMVMLTGRGAKVLCQACDATKVQRHVELFQTLQDKARAG